MRRADVPVEQCVPESQMEVNADPAPFGLCGTAETNRVFRSPEPCEGYGHPLHLEAHLETVTNRLPGIGRRQQGRTRPPWRDRRPPDAHW